MSSEGQRIWNIKIDCRASSSQELPPLINLWTFLEQLVFIGHLTHYYSHILDTVSHSLSQVIDQTIFPFISYFSHDESLWFLLLLILFLIYHLIHHTVLR